MTGKYRNLFVFVLVFGLAGSVFGGTWTNGDANNAWCNGLNWTPAGEPTSATAVVITGTPPDDLIIGCDANAEGINWTGEVAQTLTIEAGKSLTVANQFVWGYGGANHAPTINIYGDLIIDADENSAGNQVFRGPGYGDGSVNIYPGASVWCSGAFRGADYQGSSFNVYMTGGDVNTNWFKLGDEGSGDFIMLGGTFRTRRPGEQSFTIRGRDGAEFDVRIDGGATLYVEGDLMTPQEPEAIANINIDNGTISCDEWVAAGTLWTVDINEGYLRIRDSNGTTKTEVEDWIADGRITGYNGTVEPQITWDGPDLVVTVDFLHKTAYAPSPSDDGQNVCAGGSVSWGVGAFVTTHNIYFGESLDDVNESATPLVTLHGPNTWTPPGLELNKHYYWRVDEVNDLHGESPWIGGVWDFYTSDGNAFTVSPLNDEQDVPRSTDLTWASCGGTLYDVYFSTEANDVRDRLLAAQIANDTSDTTVDPIAGLLEYSTTYYWAVDVVGGVGADGDVWSFRTETAIIDPNMTVWYKLDETSDDEVLDSSGYDNHGNADGQNNWDPDDGRFGGSYVCDNDTSIEVYPYATVPLDSSISVSCWLKNAYRSNSNNWVFGIGDGEYEIRAAVVSNDNSNVEWRAGNDSNDVLRWDMVQAGIDPATLSGWHHWVFVKDEVAGNMKIYLDTVLVDSNDSVDSTLINLRLRPFTIGAASGSGSDLIGKVDDFRVFTKALTDSEVAALFRGGEVELAYSPDPFTGQKDVLREAVLSWKAGDFAVQHDVYFGTDIDAVTDANTAVPMGVYKGRQAIDAISYDPDLALGTDYYWRIDEVNDACAASPWKGKVWTFETANFILIDDFEDYNDGDNQIFNTWLEDGSSWLDLGAHPVDPVRPGGEQSMYLLFFNNVNYGGGYYSEVAKSLGDMDFTQADVKSLTVYFYGDAGNTGGASDEPYVGLTDGGEYDQVEYSPISDVQLEEWTEWNILLSDYSGLTTLTSIDTIHIGFGQPGSGTAGSAGSAFIDDVRLYPPKCVPALGPDWDWSGNCVVDLSDLGIMAGDWLRTDFLLDTSIPSPGPVGHWEFEEGSGTTVGDSAGSNNGTIEDSNDVSWVAGKFGGALEFSGSSRVRIPDAPELRPQTLTIGAWVYFSTGQNNARILVKGPDNLETYAIEIGSDDRFRFYVRDSNGNNFPVNTEISRNEWIHLAGTCDGTYVKAYVNGVEEASRDDVNGVTLSQDTNDLAIGNKADDTDNGFTGMVDDVQLYDYALSAPEVAYLVTGTTPTGYIGLDSQVNIYDEEFDGEKAVNFRDLAKFMTAWMEEKLYPE